MFEKPIQYHFLSQLWKSTHSWSIFLSFSLWLDDNAYYLCVCVCMHKKQCIVIVYLTKMGSHYKYSYIVYLFIPSKSWKSLQYTCSWHEFMLFSTSYFIVWIYYINPNIPLLVDSHSISIILILIIIIIISMNSEEVNILECIFLRTWELYFWGNWFNGF
jgi:hypothetical protein